MNEFDRLGKLAKELREKYPPGTRLELIHMEDEFAPVEDGMRGTVHFIDDMAQIHMLWDNKRTLPINVDTDSFRALTPEECYDEKCSEKEERFYDALNKDIFPNISWGDLGDAYEKRDFGYIKEILRKMHNAFVVAYGTDTLNEDMGFVSVPGVVLGGNSEICLALLDLDTMSSGEHWGTTFLTPYGIYQDEEKCHPLAKQYSSKMIPYEYWYTVGFDEDHHTDLESCPRDIREMIDDIFSEGMNQNGGISY